MATSFSPTNIEYNIGHKYLTISKKKIVQDCQKEQYEHIQFGDLSLDKLKENLLNIAESWKTYNEEFNAEPFVNDILAGTVIIEGIKDEKHLIACITNLFYSKDALSLPKIFNIINNYYLQEPDLKQCLKMLGNLKEICKIFSVLMGKVTITKDNMFSPDNKDFDATLKLSIENVERYLDQQIKTEEIIRSEDKTDLEHLIIDTMSHAQTILDFSKYGGTVNSVDKEKSSKLNILFSCLTGPVTHATPVVANIIQDTLDPNLALTGVNIGVKALLGTLWATNKEITQGNNAVFLQALGAEKGRLLRLCKQLKELGYKFTKEQQEHLEKIFELKRGNLYENLVRGFKEFNSFENLFTWNTGSYHKFREIMEEKKPCISNSSKSNATTKEKARPTRAADNPSQNQNLKLSNQNQLDQAVNDIATTAQAAQNTIFDTTDKVITCADISAKIIYYIKNKQCLSLEMYLHDLYLKNREMIKKLLPELIFEIDEFRGNLLGYVTIHGNDPDQIGIKYLKGFIYSLYSKVSSKVKIDGLPNKETIEDIQNKSYIGIRELLGLLTKYSNQMKYQCILDITHIVFAISENQNLKDKEKCDLCQFLKEQLAMKGDGIFRGIREKRSLLRQNIALGAIFYNINQSIWYINTYLGDSITNAGLIAGGAIVESILSTLEPISNYMSRGNTTTYKNVNNIVNTDIAIKQDDPNRPQQHTITSKTNTQTKTKPIQDNNHIQNIDIESTIGEIKTWIHQKIKQKDFDNLLSKLEEHTSKENKENKKNEDTLKKLYYALTDKDGDSFLLDILFDKLQIDGSKYNRLKQIWNKILNQKIKEHDVYDMNKFRKYIANVFFDNARLGLIKVYEILAVIENCENKTLKKEMAIYFAGVIYRAPNDPTSKWYDLLKRCYESEMVFKMLFRALGWSVSGAAITAMMVVSKGLSTPVILSILAAGGAIDSAISTIANNFTHATVIGTREHKAALNLLGYYIDENLIEDEKKNLAIRAKKVSSKDMKNIPKARDITDDTNGETTTQYMESIINITDNSKSENKEYSYNPNCDKNYVIALQEAVTNNNNTHITKVNEIIEDISKQVTDKYTANQALFRIIAIVSAGIEDKIERLSIILAITISFRNRDLHIAKIISEERSFYTKNHYLIPDMAAGMICAVAYFARIPYIPGVNILPIYQTLIGGAGKIAARTLMALVNNSNYSNTNSFTKDMSFLKEIILDLIIEVDNTRGQHTSEKLTAYDELLREQSVAILIGHTGRIKFGETDHSKRIPPSPNNKGTNINCQRAAVEKIKPAHPVDMPV